MRKLAFAFCATIITISLQAQIIREQTSPQTIGNQIPGYAQISSINTVTFSYSPDAPANPATPIDGDTTTEHEDIYDFGTILPANISLATGNFTTTSAGKVWTIRISIPNALNIGLTFTQFNLSPTAELYIYNDAKTVLNNKIKKEHFTSSDTLSISSVNGNALIIYVIEPNNFGAFQSNLTIGQLVAGYRAIQDVGEDTGGGSSGAQLRTASINCIPSIQCYPQHMTFARGVARIETPVGNNRVGHCSGTLINNEQNNGRAFFLTAFHCVDRNKNGSIEANEEAIWRQARFQFQFWKTQCTGSINNPFIQFNGAVLRSSSHASDVVLFELINQPGIGDGVNYIGWSRQTAPSSSTQSFIIHHPDGEDMRHTKTNNVRHYMFNDNYWQAFYSEGVVWGGSSGSALFNENNQIIGQLKGGWSSCNFTNFSDRYGKFSNSWGGANLQTWLSPAQNLQATGILDLTNIPINGPTLLQCTNPVQFSTLPGLLDVVYEWSVSGNLQIISGQGTSNVTISGIANNITSPETITLTLRSPTKGRTRIYTVSKNLNLNSGSIIGYYNSPSNTSEPLKPSKSREFNWNDACITQTISTNMLISQGSTVTWEDAGNSGGITWWQNGINLGFLFTGINQYAYFRVTVTNTCGTQSVLYRFRSVEDYCGGSQLMLMLSPNPSSGMVQASLTEKTDDSKKKDITEIRIIDKMGNIKQQHKYGQGTNTISLNISSLATDIYTVMAFDGSNWTASKLAKQ